MFCKEMLGSLSDYIDGDLEAQLCAEIEQHMAGCGNCRVVVDTLSKTVSLYREVGHEPVPPEAKDRLYAVLKLEAGGEQQETRSPPDGGISSSRSPVTIFQ